ncbi:MAG TPA: cache domain-containing protein [Geothrix sp.]|nr:cache domain-containing protein [Geothrix sp.]
MPRAASVFLFPAALTFLMAQSPKAEDAIAMTREAVAYTKAHGQEAAFKEFTTPSGTFRRFGGELYVTVYDLHGKCLAHGQEPAKVGVDALHSKDGNGKLLIQERIELAKAHGKGWQDVKYKNPHTGKLEPKAMYYELHEGLIYSVGIYK